MRADPWSRLLVSRSRVTKDFAVNVAIVVKGFPDFVTGLGADVGTLARNESGLVFRGALTLVIGSSVFPGDDYV